MSSTETVTEMQESIPVVNELGRPEIPVGIILVPLASPYRCVFEHADCLGPSEPAQQLTFSSHPGYGIGIRGHQYAVAGATLWSRWEVVTAPADIALSFEMDADGFLICMSGEHRFLRHEQSGFDNDYAGRNLTLVQGSNEETTRTSRGGACKFMLHADGSLSPTEAPHLVLGLNVEASRIWTKSNTTRKELAAAPAAAPAPAEVAPEGWPCTRKEAEMALFNPDSAFARHVEEKIHALAARMMTLVPQLEQAGLRQQQAQQHAAEAMGSRRAKPLGLSSRWSRARVAVVLIGKQEKVGNKRRWSETEEKVGNKDQLEKAQNLRDRATLVKGVAGSIAMLRKAQKKPQKPELEPGRRGLVATALSLLPIMLHCGPIGIAQFADYTQLTSWWSPPCTSSAPCRPQCPRPSSFASPFWSSGYS